MTVTAGVAAIKGTYAGEVSLLDKVRRRARLHHAGLRVPGRRARSSADVKVRLLPSAGGGTDLSYDADAVGGRDHRRGRPADARPGSPRRWPASSSPRWTPTSPRRCRRRAAATCRGRRWRDRRRPRRRRGYPGDRRWCRPRERPGQAAAPGQRGTGIALGAWVWPVAWFAAGSVGGLLALAGGRRRPDRAAALMRAFTAAAVQLAPVPGPLTAESVAANLDTLRRVHPALRRGHRRRAGRAARVGHHRVHPRLHARGAVGPGLGAARPDHRARCSEVAAELGVHLCVGTYERGPGARDRLQRRGADRAGRRRCSGSTARPTRSAGRAVCGRRLGRPPATTVMRGGHRARPDRHDHLLRRRLPRAVPDPGACWGRR